MSKKLGIAIVGSTGYGGVELMRLLHSHPNVEITSVISSSSAGTKVTEGYPHLQAIREELLDDVNPELIKQKADIVFLATPAGVASKLAPQYLEVGLKVIDLSGDFRLKDRDVYEQWYQKPAAEQEHLDKAVFGLSEIYGEQVKDAPFISNPGCFPTATLLGLIPALQANLIDHSSIIIDAKSGVSGAGRGASVANHYAELNENFKAYKVNKHQHIPEVEMVLSQIAEEPVTVTFTTHLVPMTRGILSTMYAKLKSDVTEQDLIDLYEQYYEGRPFIRIRPEGKWPATKEVWGSNYCDIGFSIDRRTNRVTIISVIDNLVKGAAGQAIQNMNLMMGWDEQLGLQFVPVYP
ncbi:N-acetyl-gamma-glutamyl-phosphate reductase [Paenibacillus endoradicis]|uniref:N-acetyl-gamma-glutamyl-phosphate reductase n=1 Tax=Paenibacillus endoradicis TaxID=2972487 RepID=UPI002158B730|nr:N-acetyl-gamma-glutamyl-phosphate reductase [Paenibacillus endoradicis]MCR8660549.1 N-acetyl-gamma-glutamyl-phosphate reductase [Paenibacillus endoradicis]